MPQGRRLLLVAAACIAVVHGDTLRDHNINKTGVEEGASMREVAVEVAAGGATALDSTHASWGYDTLRDNRIGYIGKIGVGVGSPMREAGAEVTAESSAVLDSAHASYSYGYHGYSPATRAKNTAESFGPKTSAGISHASWYLLKRLFMSLNSLLR